MGPIWPEETEYSEAQKDGALTRMKAAVLALSPAATDVSPEDHRKHLDYMNVPGFGAHLFVRKGGIMPRKYDEATRAKAVRLVVEHRDEYPSEFAAITATAKRLKLTPETLRKWVRQSEVDAGEKPGVSRAEAAEVRALKRKVAELEDTVEILKAATTFFARESDPRQL